MTPDQARAHGGEVAGYLVESLISIEARLVHLEALSGMATMTAEDIALSVYGLASADQLYRSPWRLPNFGRPDIEGKTRRWFRDTVWTWYHKPEDERRAQWDGMNSTERRRAQGRAA